jgi:glycolate oxidase FAD binding subunit
VGAEHVLTGEWAAQHPVDGLTPRAAAFPANAGEVQRILALAALERVALTVRGGGTALGLGRPPQHLDLLLGTRRMARVLEYEPADLTCTVEAGLTLGELNRVLGEQGQMLPLDAPLAGRATLGGILAANTSGPRRFAYGTARDRLIGLRIVDAQGKLIKGGGKVVKNVAGFDLPKLFIGSLGTLGVIVEATFKLAPVPKARLALLAGFKTLESALDASQAVLRQGLRPAALDLLNAQAMRRISIKTGVPVFSDRLYYLALDFGSTPAAVERQKNDGHRTLTQAGGKTQVVDDRVEYDGFWRALVDLGRAPIISGRVPSPPQTGEGPLLPKGAVAVPATMITRCSVLFSRLGPLVHGHEALAESSHLEAALDVHLGAGVLRAHWWGEGGGPADEVMAGQAVGTLRKAASHAGGAFVVEHCPSALKASIDVWGEAGSQLAIMRRLKEQFDPSRILSPGRFVGGL